MEDVPQMATDMGKSEPAQGRPRKIETDEGRVGQIRWQSTTDNIGGAGQRRGSWIGEYFPGRLARLVTDEWNDRGLEEHVTGLPTRDHWKVSESTCMPVIYVV